MGQARPLFVLFTFFSPYNDKHSANLTILIDKTIDGVLET